MTFNNHVYHDDIKRHGSRQICLGRQRQKSLSKETYHMLKKIGRNIYISRS